MTTFATEEAEWTVPESVHDISSFREWRQSDNFPEQGRIWWLQGRTWVDMTVGQIFSHVQVKTEFARILGSLVKITDLGLFLTDGAVLHNFEADISGKPDGLYLSNKTVADKKIEFIEGARGGFTEIEGSPDMVLEIISRSSVNKDKNVLRKAYWKAGIQEYWLVDAREQPPLFEILRWTPQGYLCARKQDGWMKSKVFGKSFNLIQTLSIRNLFECSLESALIVTLSHRVGTDLPSRPLRLAAVSAPVRRAVASRLVAGFPKIFSASAFWKYFQEGRWKP